MRKILILLLSVILLLSFIGGWAIVSGGYDKQNEFILVLKKIIPSKIARNIRDKIFFIPELKNRNDFLELQLTKYEQGLKGEMFVEKKSTTKNKRYNYTLRNFFLPFPSLDLSLAWDANENKLRAHYFEIVEDKILVISGEGDTVYFDRKNIDETKLNLKRIDNNLRELLLTRNVILSAIRDLYFDGDFIYVSILESKHNNSFFNIYRARKDFKSLNFEIFFECNETIDVEGAPQTGGRITSFSPNEILFSVGFFGMWKSTQDKNSTFGKIIAINKDTKKYNLISIGHRNPQGLFFLKEKNIVINSEHGPKGGDEINFNFLNKNKITNFGWPIVSNGEPYGNGQELKEKGYFKKSHSAHGFEEPFKDFTPAIGISEITFNDNKLYVSSLRAESIYILELTKDYKIIDQTRINVGSRIRDLRYDKENDIFLILLENIPAIGVLKFN